MKLLVAALVLSLSPIASAKKPPRAPKPVVCAAFVKEGARYICQDSDREFLVHRPALVTSVDPDGQARQYLVGWRS